MAEDEQNQSQSVASQAAVMGHATQPPAISAVAAALSGAAAGLAGPTVFQSASAEVGAGEQPKAKGGKMGRFWGRMWRR